MSSRNRTLHLKLKSFLYFQAGVVMKRNSAKLPRCEQIPEVRDIVDNKDPSKAKDSSPLMASSPFPMEIPVPELPTKRISSHWVKHVCNIYGY